ncbi:uncharacterized protein LOC110769256, partial [Prunus avium]|uniref:Uncharacterized protein LOC110769256 n=1 Tax=Prunus avium TaxID=42229 RepID=A0A6P5TP93_PRUAV
MSILYWNAKGAACTKFRNTMQDLIRSHHMEILFVCEPRISGLKAVSMVKTLGFPCFEIVDPIGFSGGLWLMWDDSRVKVEIIGTHDQAISACISWPGQTPWIFTAVYAKPCGFKRDKLWEYLSFVEGCHNLPWLLAGDFNDMLNKSDKLGGAPIRRLRGFKPWFDQHAMCDLGFSGPKYTWTNKKVLERIDRAVCNTQWRSLFADAHVIHLPRTKSDHSPLKICFKSKFSSSPLNRPFRFEAMWLKHENFPEFIAQNWELSYGSALDKSCALVEPLKQWNLSVFGHLKQKKARILARLAGLQKALHQGPNTFLINLESILVADFNYILDQEAMFWRQKSRVKWLQEGDRNTKFFHLSTIIRRRRNKIDRLKNDAGLWVEESDGIKNLAMQYFSELFSPAPVATNSFTIPNMFPSIDPGALESLVADVDMEEVKVNLFSIGGLKAPGVDGFPACFYQKQWNTCANDILDLVHQSIQDCRIPGGLNSTMITL